MIFFSFFAFHFFRSFFLHVFLLHSRFVVEKCVVVVVVVFVMMLVLVVETDFPIVRHRENDGGEMMRKRVENFGEVDCGDGGGMRRVWRW